MSEARIALFSAAVVALALGVAGVAQNLRMPIQPRPTIGRIVHYVLSDGEHCPAIIVRIWAGVHLPPAEEPSVNLHVFPDKAVLSWQIYVPEDPSGTRRGSWHWPEAP